MCTSRTDERLVGQLECYMDDMVDCFEDFVKKSMLVVSMAVGSLVLMVMYVLKRMIERAATRSITCGTTVSADTECKCCQVCIQDLTANIENLCTNTKSLINAYLPSANCTTTVSSQVIPSIECNFTKGFKTCIISKSSDTCKQTQVCEDLKNARNELTTATKPPFKSKISDQLSNCRRCSQVIVKENSCCSMCCGDERCKK